MAAILFWSKGIEEYRYLSNFYKAPFAYNRQWWPTAEHLFFALQYNDKASTISMLDNESDSILIREHIRTLPTPQAAKAWAKEHRDGQNGKDHLALMRMVTMLKYSQNPDLAHRLIATGEQELVHDAPWGDTYWGRKDGVGQNWQGRIIMEIRAQLAAWMK